VIEYNSCPGTGGRRSRWFGPCRKLSGAGHGHAGGRPGRALRRGGDHRSPIVEHVDGPLAREQTAGTAECDEPVGRAQPVGRRRHPGRAEPHHMNLDARPGGLVLPWHVRSPRHDRDVTGLDIRPGQLGRCRCGIDRHSRPSGPSGRAGRPNVDPAAGKRRRVAGEHGTAHRLGPLTVDPGEQPLAGLLFGAADELDVHQRPEQAVRRTVVDQNRNHQVLRTGRVEREVGAPFWPRVGARQEVRTQHEHDSSRLPTGIVHECGPVTTWAKVPGFHDHRAAGALQLPGDPFCPRPVSMVVADEKVDLSSHFHLNPTMMDSAMRGQPYQRLHRIRRPLWCS